MSRFNVTILGSSSALPTSKRYPTAQVLNILERFFLIDCGEGTQLQLRKNSIKLGKINRILISHLHGDHYFGLIGLLSTYSLLGRKTDLHIHCHSNLPIFLEKQLEILSKDIQYNIVWHPLSFKSPQNIYEDARITVESFPLEHRIPCCGFLFKEKIKDRKIVKHKIDLYSIPLKQIPEIKEGADFIQENGSIIPNQELTLPPDQPRSYAFVTDTKVNYRLAEKLLNTTTLYHEATFGDDLENMAEQTFHTTARQAAKLANEAQIGKLLLGHFSSRYKDISPLIEQAKETFPKTVGVEDNNTYDVSEDL